MSKPVIIDVTNTSYKDRQLLLKFMQVNEIKVFSKSKLFREHTLTTPSYLGKDEFGDYLSVGFNRKVKVLSIEQFMATNARLGYTVSYAS